MEISNPINFFDNRFLMFVVDGMANELEKKGEKVIRMTLGKSELPLHPSIIQAMQDALGDFSKSSLVYPAGLPELKKRLSRYYLEQYDTEIKPDNIIISPGTSSAFRNLFSLLSGPGDEVLLPIPYYSLYRFSAMLAGASIRYYRIEPETGRLDVNSFEQNFTDRTKIVVINTPGNPLGNVLTNDELGTIDRIVNGRAAIINDEIYCNTYFDERNKSVMELKDTRSVFITTNAFSKAYRMYSRRIGYSIVPDELVEPMTVLQHHTLLTVDPVVQYGAIAALEREDEVCVLVNHYRERRNYTEHKLADVKGVHVYHSAGGFYITLDCSEFMRANGFSNSLELASDILRKVHVATVPGSDFGLPNTLRLSFSSKDYPMGIDRLYTYFTTYVL